MARDLVLYYESKTGVEHELGEVQSDFNMSFVIDETKDSCQIIVYSYNNIELTPYTLVKHEKTNTWWVVSHDKVERNMNESGFFYIHTIELLGAIELLNARDLTDCAFYQNNYTVSTFLSRLFSLSNFEYSGTFNFNGLIDPNENIDYIKTYENYTLLSAIKDFLNGYNCTAKLTFEVSQNQISSAILNIYSKTGFVNETILDINSFNNVREIKTYDKSSYGTSVISNVDNATATKMQKYPVWGGVRLVSDSYTLDLEKAYIRLPSNLNNISWVKIYYEVTIKIVNTGGTTEFAKTFYSFDSNLIDSTLEDVTNYINANHSNFNTSWESNKESVKETMSEIGVSTLYKGVDINAYTGAYVSHSLLIPEIHTNLTQQNLILVEEDVKKALVKPTDGIGYQKGSNKINVDFLGRTNNGYFTTDSKSCDCGYYSGGAVLQAGTDFLSVQVECGSNITARKLLFAVEYEPMSDLKIKIDNDRETNDIQLYNQNGKFTDSGAFSKLLNSYSKEISSNSITKYSTYYDFTSIPKVGTLVKSGTTLYVINNISLDFYQNDGDNSVSYLIKAEINLSMYVSTKSLMVNPNSNIRDYGIPQKNTIKRKQLYRDYVEFAFKQNTQYNNAYRFIDKTLPFYKREDELVRALVRTTWDSNSQYYYQLDTTIYVFKKLKVTMLDLQDNNIIGYDFQNIFSGFDISRVLSANGMNNDTNVPIQYTDEYGKVKTFDFRFLTTKEYNDAIDSYIASQSADTDYKYVLTSRCFINYGVWSYASNYGFPLSVTNYNKDPLEIPVFEYLVQIGSSQDVLICDNIFINDNESRVYTYSFKLVDKDKANEYNGDLYYDTEFTISNLLYSYDNAVELEYYGYGFNKVLLVKLWDNCVNKVYSGQTSIPTNKDIIIYRNVLKTKTSGTPLVTEYVVERHEPIMIIRTNENTTISDNEITLYNHLYKLR